MELFFVDATAADQLIHILTNTYLYPLDSLKSEKKTDPECLGELASPMHCVKIDTTRDRKSLDTLFENLNTILGDRMPACQFWEPIPSHVNEVPVPFACYIYADHLEFLFSTDDAAKSFVTQMEEKYHYPPGLFHIETQGADKYPPDCVYVQTCVRINTPSWRSQPDLQGDHPEMNPDIMLKRLNTILGDHMPPAQLANLNWEKSSHTPRREDSIAPQIYADLMARKAREDRLRDQGRIG